MKKILIGILSFISLACFGQAKTDAQLIANGNTVISAGPGQNTAARIGGDFNDLAYSKLSVLPLVATGTNTYVSTSSAITSYSNCLFEIQFQNGNSGASTLNINGYGAVNLQKLVSGSYTALSSGDIQANQVLKVWYDQPNNIFQIFLGSSGGAWGSITGTLSNQTDLQTALNAKQSTITFGTGVQTALGVNIGSAGAPVLFNGSGGTPSSLTLTNATGLPAASINAGALANGMTATTQPPGTNNGTIATTGYVDALTLTISTGLTNTSGTLTADLSTGKSGGQSVIGGTASGNNLTLSSTSHATKGSIIFGASSYSEANNTISWVLNTQGSSMGGSWTGTASGQDHFIINPTITGRSNGSGGNADVYNLFEIGGSFVVGSGTSAQVARSLYLTSTFPVGMQGRELISTNPTWSTTGSADYLMHLQSASSDRFRIRYNGDLFQSGTTADFTGSSTIALRSPASTFSSSGTNVDVIVFNTGGTKAWRHRATNVDVYTFNDGTNDIYTVSSSLWTFNRVIKFGGTNTTGGGSALLGTNSPATTNTAPYTWVQITTSDGSTAYIPAWK